MRWLFEWIGQFFIGLAQPVATISYVGIAAVSARMPVYRRPAVRGRPIAYLEAGQYAPHFTATADHLWLEITTHSGDKGWLQNDPARVMITFPDPTQVTVCIDPGHGGSDSGATGNGLIEKHLNFDIAYNRLRPRLLADDRIDRLWFTRTGDQSVSLAYRTDLGNAAGSWLFVSVHNNSYLASSSGTETYYKGGTEGSADIRARSQRAGCLLHQRIAEQLTLHCPRPGLCPWRDRGVISRLLSQSDPRSYYYVLRNSHGPAVILEYLYVSNPNEASCLAGPDFRDCLAQATYDGIADCLFTDTPGDNCLFRTLYGL